MDNPEDKPVNHVETLPSGGPFVALLCYATSSAMSSTLKLVQIRPSPGDMAALSLRFDLVVL